DVASHFDHVEIGPASQDLRLPAQARRTDASTLRHFAPGTDAPDVGVAWVLALQDTGDLEALGKIGGKVLGGVHPQVDLALEQRALDLLDEARLVADCSVGGLDGHDLCVAHG